MTLLSASRGCARCSKTFRALARAERVVAGSRCKRVRPRRNLKIVNRVVIPPATSSRTRTRALLARARRRWRRAPRACASRTIGTNNMARAWDASAGRRPGVRWMPQRARCCAIGDPGTLRARTSCRSDHAAPDTPDPRSRPARLSFSRYPPPRPRRLHRRIADLGGGAAADWSIGPGCRLSGCVTHRRDGLLTTSWRRGSRMLRSARSRVRTRDAIVLARPPRTRCPGAAVPFSIRPGLVAEMVRFYDVLRRQSQDVTRFEATDGRRPERRRGAGSGAEARLLSAADDVPGRRVSRCMNVARRRERRVRRTRCAIIPAHRTLGSRSLKLIVTVADWIARSRRNAASRTSTCSHASRFFPASTSAW